MIARNNYIFTIGIDTYPSEAWKDLNNAVLDSKKIIQLLTEKYAFEEYPDSLYNEQATKQNIYSAFNTLQQIIGEEDNLIIFFAGHGNMNPHSHRGYWIPYEGDNDLTSWIENSVVKDFIQDIKAKHILLIVDACFSGTFLTRTRDITIESTYLELESKKSRWVITSGSEEKVSDGIPNHHSPFSKYLIKYLELNDSLYTSVSEILNYVRLFTINNSKQTPLGAHIHNIEHNGGELVLKIESGEINFHNTKTIGIPSSATLRNEYLLNLKAQNKFSAGKEILIVNSFIDEYDYLIIENFRFNEAGNKKIRFDNDLAIIDKTDDSKNLCLIQRFATWVGVSNYLEKNEAINNSKVATIHAHEDIEKIEEHPNSIAYSLLLTQVYDFNKNKMTCLHCGEKISDNESYLVEFDEIDMELNVGNAHFQCLRPSDRILGSSRYETDKKLSLLNFDYDLWLNLYPTGQGQIKSSYKNLSQDSIYIISWNPENNKNEGKYCIKQHFDNGDQSYIMLGNLIQRFTDEEIEHWMIKFSESIDRSSLGKIVETNTFGFIEELSKIKTPEQSISKVTKFTKVKYSRQFEKHTENYKNDYTPLGLLRFVSDDKTLTLNKIVPLISNPLDIDKFLSNWNDINPDIPTLKLKIIESDHELGTFISLFEGKELTPVIDPIFDNSSKKLSSGLVIKSLATIIKEAQHKPSFKAGDLVKLYFPGVTSPKKPFGILLTDSFLDEKNEECAIFRAIEEGVEREELTYKIPTNLMVKQKK